MNKICTTTEQSKKLIELGIDVNTADMHYSTWTILNEGEYILSPNQGETIEELQEDYGNQIIPAWSLTALLGLMPTFTLNGFGNGQFNCRDERANSYALVDTCPLDAVFGMICWLKENKKL